jgi:hypothetical protein
MVIGVVEEEEEEEEEKIRKADQRVGRFDGESGDRIPAIPERC